MIPSEPHKIIETYHPKAEAFGVVHNGWRYEPGGLLQMGCCMVTKHWTNLDDHTPVTCVWCLANYCPWLNWTSPADPNPPVRGDDGATQP